MKVSYRVELSRAVVERVHWIVCVVDFLAFVRLSAIYLTITCPTQ
ncbi:hypothetical protein [Oscillatoria sp. FACHB-1407]|nr:hypothetical protein [Oscillatoria sp. FACHB-1407]